MANVNVLLRRARRFNSEVNHIITINVRDVVQVSFVWYPGERRPSNSLVNPTVKPHPKSGKERLIYYTWQRDGAARAIRRPIVTGVVTIDLPPGKKGKLKAFDTEWELTRRANGVSMRSANSVRGQQQRLNRLGYHLRRPGSAHSGVDGSLGRRTELAIIQFQADYRPAAGGNRLNIRGEGAANTDAKYTGNLTRYGRAAALPNPSTADSAALRAALIRYVGS